MDVLCTRVCVCDKRQTQLASGVISFKPGCAHAHTTCTYMHMHMHMYMYVAVCASETVWPMAD